MGAYPCGWRGRAGELLLRRCNSSSSSSSGSSGGGGGGICIGIGTGSIGGIVGIGGIGSGGSDGGDGCDGESKGEGVREQGIGRLRCSVTAAGDRASSKRLEMQRGRGDQEITLAQHIVRGY